MAMSDSRFLISILFLLMMKSYVSSANEAGSIVECGNTEFRNKIDRLILPFQEFCQMVASAL